MKSVCNTCGQVHQRCAGHKDDKPCGRWPTKGTTVCRSHGAAAPWIASGAARSVARQQLRAEVMKWRLGDNDIDPEDTLLRLIKQSTIRADRLADEIEALVEEHGFVEAHVGETFIVDTEGGSLHKVGEYTRGLSTLENAERDRCAKFSAMAIAAGLVKKQIEVAEQQVGLAERALMAALQDVGMSPEQQRQAAGRLAHHLRIA